MDGRFRPAWWAFLAASAAGVFLCCLCSGELVFIELPGTLLLGWVPFLQRVAPEIGVDVGGVITGLVSLAAFTIGLHAFLAWLHRETRAPTSASWRWRWTLSIVGVIVLMFAAGISAVGLTHQSYWLANSPEPWVSMGRLAHYQSRLMNEVRQMVLAAHNYASNHQEELPPVAIEDPQGRRLLSWRVLLLPYLEQDHLYKQFKLDEPWDSPHNLALLPRMPLFFGMPVKERFGARDSNERCLTAYRIFVGPRTLYPGKGARSPYTFTKIPDGAAATMFIVEANDPVPWTKPDELVYAPDRPIPALGGAIRGKFLVGMLDGSVRTIKRDVSEPTLRSAIEANDGMELGPDWE